MARSKRYDVDALESAQARANRAMRHDGGKSTRSDRIRAIADDMEDSDIDDTEDIPVEEYDLDDQVHFASFYTEELEELTRYGNGTYSFGNFDYGLDAR